MKTKISQSLIFLLLTFTFSCEKPERNNPWDEKANINPSAWAPQNLQIEDVSITEKKLTWTYDDKSIEGFKLDRKKGDDPWQVAYQTFAKEARSWNDEEIIPDTSLNYSYRLYAFAGQLISTEQTLSASIEFAAPTKLQTEKLTDKSYKLTWMDNSTGEQGFKVDRKIDEGNWVLGYGNIVANQTFYTDTNVFRATNVEYRVYAFYENYESSKTTINANAELTSPTDLQITNNSITTVTLTWQDNSTGVDGFKIERKYEGGSWEQLTAISSNTYEENDFDLNTQVYYRVCAYVGANNSSWIENGFDATIPSPINFQIINNSITSVTLNWQDHSTGEDGFKLERKYEGGSWEQLATITTNSYENSDFDLNTQVYYRVCAYVETYNSSWAENDFDATIPPPENLDITANSSTSVTLIWDYNYSGHDGFKIDRRVNESLWVEEFETINAGQTSFSDNGGDLINNIYSYRVYAYYNQYESSIIENQTPYCGFPFINNRDGKEYETVQIGDQCWMKENLAYLPSVNPSSNGSETVSYYYVYGYQGTNIVEAKTTSNYQTYGVLYNWPASLTACPQGWSLPTDDEWTILTEYLGGSSVAGGKMKETGTAHWNSPNIGATNSSGYTGLPGCYRGTNGTFNNLGSLGTFWSSSETSTTNAWYRPLNYYNANLDRSTNTKGYGFSVRCLRDL